MMMDFQCGLPSRIYWTRFCIPASSPSSPINRGCRRFTPNGTVDNVSIFPWAVLVYPVNPVWPEEVISPVNSDRPLSRRYCLCLVLYDIVENHALINTQAPLVDHPPLSPSCSTDGQNLVRPHLGVIPMVPGILRLLGHCPVKESAVHPMQQMSCALSTSEYFSGVTEPRSPCVRTAFPSCPVMTGFHISWN